MKKILNYIILFGLFGITLWLILNEGFIENFQPWHYLFCISGSRT